MLKRLRMKFVFINMTIVTMMLCIILGLVYQFTKGYLETENLGMMENIASHPYALDSPYDPGEDIRLPYFMVQINENGELTTTNSGNFDLSNDTLLKELVNKIMSSSSNIGVIEEYNLRYYHESSMSTQKIVVTDISSELSTLKGLINNSLNIGLVSFFVFLLISILLARWAVKPVEQTWKQQKQFVADASHELKTPLTVIMTNAEMMQNSEFDDVTRSKFVQNILIMSRQMRELIEQMLTLARTDNNISKDKLSPVDFSELVSKSILPFEPIFYEKGMLLTSNIEEKIIVNGIKSQLYQVLEILLDNAQKYSKNSGNIKITLARKRKNRCILTVANEGESISKRDAKKIFKRFYQADESRSQRGSFGLGLSIAERIISYHQGKIWVESKDGINYFNIELRCS